MIEHMAHGVTAVFHIYLDSIIVLFFLFLGILFYPPAGVLVLILAALLFLGGLTKR